ncbi:glycosyltransferase [Pseudodesulfovibrio sp. F-1]|uniref:Glycosyltransferase n=2 Tax=Pseudodesulfovibrio alkaliphilus TaxID=2661613 RepID=A0A7K1KPB6_9BACT|nr:glycosyltransferase [Pseudodesulfovibrio alkaliphilus]
MRRAVLVISSLGMGGAESVMAWLAAGLDSREVAVTILTFDHGDDVPYYPLPAGVVVRHLKLSGPSLSAVGGLLNNVRRCRVLRSAILTESPDVVVSFMEQTNVLTLLAVGGRCPVVVSERVHPMYPVGRPWAWLRRCIYGRAAALVVQTASIGREYGWLKTAQVKVIPNAAIPSGCKEPTVRFSGPAVVGMGRLHEQKGFDILLRAFAKVAMEFPQWKLVIFGDGPKKSELQELTTSLGLAHRVVFAGQTPTPHADLAQGDIFAFPSRFEGFPNALCEAMTIGMACVAADCPGGPADLIDDGRNGLLVPPGDVKALTETLGRLMADQPLRIRLGLQAGEVVERFSVERVMDQWEACLIEAVATNPGKRLKQCAE